MAEYWDIYNKDRERTGKIIERGEPLGEDEFYVCCEVWIVNSDNQMLVTQRNPNKKAGGLWEFTGGGVLAGETTRQAAVREVKEELGVSLEETELERFEVYPFGHYFMDIYVVRKDIKPEEIVLDRNEVVDCAWYTADEIERLIEEHKMVRSVGIRYSMYGAKLMKN